MPKKSNPWDPGEFPKARENRKTNDFVLILEVRHDGDARRFNPPPLGWALLNDCSYLSLSGRVFPPLPSRRPCTCRRAIPKFECESVPKWFFRSKKKRIGAISSLGFWVHFSNLCWLRHQFSTILDPKTGPQGFDFRCFSESSNFLKIMLPQ